MKTLLTILATVAICYAFYMGRLPFSNRLADDAKLEDWRTDLNVAKKTWNECNREFDAAREIAFNGYFKRSEELMDATAEKMIRNAEHLAALLKAKPFHLELSASEKESLALTEEYLAKRGKQARSGR